MMRWLRALVWAVLPCRHADLAGHSLMYRERRRLSVGKTSVQHLVCLRCGHARPAMDRSAWDHARVVRIGRAAADRLTVRRTTPADVVDIRARQGSRHAYRAAEARLQTLVYHRFGLTGVEPASVKAADTLALHAELRDLVASSDPAHATAAAAVPAIVPQKPELARHLFLQRFQTIVNGK